MENISILDLFEVLGDFVADPADEEAAQKVSDYKSKLVIRNFLPMKQKEAAMLKTLYDIQAVDVESHHFSAAMEISLTFNALLAYVVNIDYDIEEALKDEIFYDVFWVSGMGDYILSFCEKDYNRLRDMVERMVSFENLKELLEEVSKMAPDSIDRLTDMFKSFSLKDNSELIRNLADIARHQDPLLTKVKDSVVEGAWKEIDKAQKKREKEQNKE